MTEPWLVVDPSAENDGALRETTLSRRVSLAGGRPSVPAVGPLGVKKSASHATQWNVNPRNPFSSIFEDHGPVRDDLPFIARDPFNLIPSSEKKKISWEGQGVGAVESDEDDLREQSTGLDQSARRYCFGFF